MGTHLLYAPAKSTYVSTPACITLNDGESKLSSECSHREHIVHRYQMAPLLLYLIRTKKTDGLMAEMLYNLIQLKSITDTISSSILRSIFLSYNLLKYESKCGVSLLHKYRMQYEELWSFSQVSLPFHISLSLWISRFPSLIYVRTYTLISEHTFIPHMQNLHSHST